MIRSFAIHALQNEYEDQGDVKLTATLYSSSEMLMIQLRRSMGAFMDRLEFTLTLASTLQTLFRMLSENG